MTIKKREVTMITEADIEFVSLVSNGANRTPFKVIKSEGGVNMVKGRDGESGKILLEYNMRRSSIMQKVVLTSFVSEDYGSYEHHPPEDDGETFEIL